MYGDWLVGAKNPLGLLQSLDNYITAGPDGPLKRGQVEFRVRSDKPYVDYFLNAMWFSCSNLGGLVAVPCTVRMHYTASPLSGSGSKHWDISYTPTTLLGVVNTFTKFTFTGAQASFGFDHITFELISATIPSQTLINVAGVDYNANIYQ